MKNYLSLVIAIIIIFNNCNFYVLGNVVPTLSNKTSTYDIEESTTETTTVSTTESMTETTTVSTTESTTETTTVSTTESMTETTTVSTTESTTETTTVSTTESTTETTTVSTTENTTETTTVSTTENTTETTTEEKLGNLEFGKDYYYEDLVLEKGNQNYSLTSGITYDRKKYTLGIKNKGDFDINVAGEYSISYVLVEYKTKQIAAVFSRIVKVIEKENEKYVFDLPELNIEKGSQNYNLLEGASVKDNEGNSLKLYVKDKRNFDVEKVGKYKILIGIENLEIEKERTINVFLDNTEEEIQKSQINVKFGENYKVYETIKEAFEYHKEDTEIEIILSGEYTLSLEDIKALKNDTKERIIIRGFGETNLNVSQDLYLNGTYLKLESLKINLSNQNLKIDANSLFLEISNVEFVSNLPDVYAKNYVTLKNTNLNSLETFGIVTILEKVYIEKYIQGFKTINIGKLNKESLEENSILYVGKIDSTISLQEEPSILATFDYDYIRKMEKNSINQAVFSINVNEQNNNDKGIVSLMGNATIILKKTGNIIEKIKGYGSNNNIIVSQSEEAPITLKNEIESQESISVGVLEILEKFQTEEGIKQLEEELKNAEIRYPIIKYEMEETSEIIKGIRDYRIQKSDFEFDLSKENNTVYYRVFKGFGKDNLYLMRVSDEFFQKNPNFVIEDLKRIYSDEKNEDVLFRKSFNQEYGLFEILEKIEFEEPETSNNLVIMINKDKKIDEKTGQEKYLYYIDEKIAEKISDFGKLSEKSKIIIVGLSANYNNDMLSADTNLFIGNPEEKGEAKDYFINVNSDLIFKNIDIETPKETQNEVTFYMNGNKFIANENVSATKENYEELSTFAIEEYYQNQQNKKSGINIVIGNETDGNPIKIQTSRYFNINNIAVAETLINDNIDLNINLLGENIWVNRVLDNNKFSEKYKHSIPRKRVRRTINEKGFSINGGNIGILNVTSEEAKIASNLETLEVEMGTKTKIAEGKKIVNLISDSEQNSQTTVINNAEIENVIIGAKTNPKTRRLNNGVFEFTFENNGSVQNLQFGTEQNVIGEKNVKVVNNGYIHTANGSANKEDAPLNNITFEGGEYETIIGGGGNINVYDVNVNGDYVAINQDYDYLGNINNNIQRSRVNNFIGGNAIDSNFEGTVKGDITNNISELEINSGFYAGNYSLPFKSSTLSVDGDITTNIDKLNISYQGNTDETIICGGNRNGYVSGKITTTIGKPNDLESYKTGVYINDNWNKQETKQHTIKYYGGNEIGGEIGSKVKANELTIENNIFGIYGNQVSNEPSNSHHKFIFNGGSAITEKTSKNKNLYNLNELKPIEKIKNTVVFYDVDYKNKKPVEFEFFGSGASDFKTIENNVYSNNISVLIGGNSINNYTRNLRTVNNDRNIVNNINSTKYLKPNELITNKGVNKIGFYSGVGTGCVDSVINNINGFETEIFIGGSLNENSLNQSNPIDNIENNFKGTFIKEGAGGNFTGGKISKITNNFEKLEHLNGVNPYNVEIFIAGNGGSLIGTKINRTADDFTLFNNSDSSTQIGIIENNFIDSSDFNPNGTFYGGSAGDKSNGEFEVDKVYNNLYNSVKIGTFVGGGYQALKEVIPATQENEEYSKVSLARHNIIENRFLTKKETNNNTINLSLEKFIGGSLSGQVNTVRNFCFDNISKQNLPLNTELAQSKKVKLDIKTFIGGNGIDNNSFSLLGTEERLLPKTIDNFYGYNYNKSNSEKSKIDLYIGGNSGLYNSQVPTPLNIEGTEKDKNLIRENLTTNTINNNLLGHINIKNFIGGSDRYGVNEVNNYINSIEGSYYNGGGAYPNITFTKNINNYLNKVILNENQNENVYIGGDGGNSLVLNSKELTDVLKTSNFAENISTETIKNYIQSIDTNKFYGGGYGQQSLNTQNHLGFKLKLNNKIINTQNDLNINTKFISGAGGTLYKNEEETMPSNDITTKIYNSINNDLQIIGSNEYQNLLPEEQANDLNIGNINLQICGGGYQETFSLDGEVYTIFNDSVINIPETLKLTLDGEFHSSDSNGSFVNKDKFNLNLYGGITSNSQNPLAPINKNTNSEQNILYNETRITLAKVPIDNKYPDYIGEKWPIINGDIYGGNIPTEKDLPSNISFEKTGFTIKAGEVQNVFGGCNNLGRNKQPITIKDIENILYKDQEDDPENTKASVYNWVGGSQGNVRVSGINNSSDGIFDNPESNYIGGNTGSSSSSTGIIRNNLLRINCKNYIGGNNNSANSNVNNIFNNISNITFNNFYGAGYVTEGMGNAKQYVASVSTSIGMTVKRNSSIIISKGKIKPKQANATIRNPGSSSVETTNSTLTVYMTDDVTDNSNQHYQTMKYLLTNESRDRDCILAKFILMGSGISEYSGEYNLCSNDKNANDYSNVFDFSKVYINEETVDEWVSPENIKLEIYGNVTARGLDNIKGKARPFPSTGSPKGYNSSLTISPFPEGWTSSNLKSVYPTILGNVNLAILQNTDINTATINIYGGSFPNKSDIMCFPESKPTKTVKEINFTIDNKFDTVLDIKAVIKIDSRTTGSMSSNLNLTIGDPSNVQLKSNKTIINKICLNQNTLRSINFKAYDGIIDSIIGESVGDVSNGIINFTVDKFAAIKEISLFSDANTIHRKRINFIYTPYINTYLLEVPKTTILLSKNCNNSSVNSTITANIKPDIYIQNSDTTSIRKTDIQLIDSNLLTYNGTILLDVGGYFDGSIAIGRENDIIGKFANSVSMDVQEGAKVRAYMPQVPNITIGQNATFDLISKDSTTTSTQIGNLTIGQNATFNHRYGTKMPQQDVTIADTNKPLEVRTINFGAGSSIGLQLVPKVRSVSEMAINRLKVLETAQYTTNGNNGDKIKVEFLYPEEYSNIETTQLPAISQEAFYEIPSGATVDASKFMLKPNAKSTSKLQEEGIRIKGSNNILRLGAAETLNISIPTKLLFIGITSDKENLIKSPMYTISNNSSTMDVKVEVVGMEEIGSSTNQFQLATSTSDANNKVSLKIKTGQRESNLLNTYTDISPYVLGTLQRKDTSSASVSNHKINFELVGTFGEELKNQANTENSLKRGSFNTRFRFTQIP